MRNIQKKIWAKSTQKHKNSRDKKKLPAETGGRPSQDKDSANRERAYRAHVHEEQNNLKVASNLPHK
jgi:hypothetical protein